MPLPLKTSLVSLALIPLILVGAGCSSGSANKISKSDIAKINAANTKLKTLALNLKTVFLNEKGLCVSQTKNAKDADNCINKLELKFKTQAKLGSLEAARVYEEVAAESKGNCQKTLNVVVRDLRANAKGLDTGTFPSAEHIQKDLIQALSTCGLKIEVPK